MSPDPRKPAGAGLLPSFRQHTGKAASFIIELRHVRFKLYVNVYFAAEQRKIGAKWV